MYSAVRSQLKFLAGVCIGVNAALISIVTEWLSDIKMGYCSDGWWLNQQFCCWEIEGDENACDSWHPWSDVGAARWFIYVLFAVWHRPHYLVMFTFDLMLGVFLVHRGALGEIFCEIRCRLRDIRNQVYIGRFCHEGLSRSLDACDQELDSG